MASDWIIRCDGVVKHYYDYHHRSTSLREVFINLVKGRPLIERTEKTSVHELSARIDKGESVALIGANGSGKSTLLRLIAGVYSPSAGKIETRGRLTAVIELGAGFNGELTGKENIALYGAIMGLDRQQIRERYAEIVAFADIGEAIDAPVKYYSSGMQARLAFSVAVCANPEILLIDEVLAVGDEAFRAKCLGKIRQFLNSGGTLVAVSHDLDTIGDLCPRGIWLDQGELRMDGPVKDVVGAYRAASQ
jgi:ABC-2 type transport system ATP-binding protein